MSVSAAGTGSGDADDAARPPPEEERPPGEQGERREEESLLLHWVARGDGPPVVLLHGLYGSGGNLNRVTRHLSRRYRVLVPDLRNHGRSPHHPRMDYPAMAGDVVALLAAAGIEQAAVVGHSMGGKVAMTLALQQPQRVAALVVGDIAPVAYEHSHGRLLAALQEVAVATAPSRQAVDAALAERIADAQVRQFLLTNLVPRSGADGGYTWRIPLATLAAAVPEIESFPACSGSYPGPTLFLYGDRSDYFVPQRDEPAVCRLFPRAQQHALAGAGHWLHAEQPQAFNAALSDFLQRHW
ncbi:alpha/beta hydrolase [Halorhodospira abdelmalekii]|uniref:alpha/beta fold hydrolase n=1 Tax=Halorhodospira abdelmalekii TaxID=421629 RepID=UPI001906D77E|nr:alpha/beta fold hydrolase [Halorhodospira abdelmalekii]MBK1734004.1 alpha/beta hydrolase [Halorhodospira abdelmalekii]